MRTEPNPTYALVAEFSTPDALIAAARLARAAGYRRVEGFSPFPVEGLEEALDLKERRLGPLMLVGGVGGAVAGVLMQVGVALDFPLDVGGRPLLSWPAYVLIAFEFTVLGAVLTGILAMLILDRLPRLHHPLFNLESFHFATADKFFLAILASDPQFDDAKVKRFLRRLKPLAVETAPWRSEAS